MTIGNWSRHKWFHDELDMYRLQIQTTKPSLAACLGTVYRSLQARTVNRAVID
jgi:hypothetical protein